MVFWNREGRVATLAGVAWVFYWGSDIVAENWMRRSHFGEDLDIPDRRTHLYRDPKVWAPLLEGFIHVCLYLCLCRSHPLGMIKNSWRVEHLIIALLPCPRRMYKCTAMWICTEVPSSWSQGTLGWLPAQTGFTFTQEECLILIPNKGLSSLSLGSLETTSWCR